MADRETKRGRWKYKNLDNEKSFLDEIKNIFYSFLKGYHLVKNKNLMKNSRHQLSANDIALFADEATSAAWKEMMGVVIGYFDEVLKSLIWDFISLVSVSFTKSEILIEKIKEVMMNCGIVITRTRFVCFNGTNSMSFEKSGVQRHYQNDAPFSIYVNCRWHRLFYTKLLIGFKILYYLSWSR